MSDKLTKAESNGEVRKEPVKSMRLASLFSASRDLSLVKTNQRATPQTANKRSYAPNLNVARHKNTEKPSDVDNSRKNQKHDRGRNSRGRGARNNNFNNRKSNLVSTAGVFSEGIAVTPTNRRSGEYFGSGSSRDTAVTQLEKPRIVKRDLKPDKAELDAQQKTLTELLGDEDEFDLDDIDSKTSSSDDFLPIKIRDPNKRSIAGVDSKKQDANVKIKVEPIDDVAMAPSISPENSLLPCGTSIKTEPGIDVKPDSFHRLDKLFEASPSEFLLFQLPDTLPGRAPETDTPSTSTSTIQPQKPNLCSLEHLDEGLIGKLVRHRSGKTKLVLGDMVYDVDLGLTSDFTQHAVTINANTAERSANVFSLGQVNTKFNVTPDWIHLFHKMTP